MARRKKRPYGGQQLISLRVPDSLHSRLKALSVLTGVSMSDYIRTATLRLIEYLEAGGKTDGYSHVPDLNDFTVLGSQTRRGRIITRLRTAGDLEALYGEEEDA